MIRRTDHDKLRNRLDDTLSDWKYNQRLEQTFLDLADGARDSYSGQRRAIADLREIVAFAYPGDTEALAMIDATLEEMDR